VPFLVRIPPLLIIVHICPLKKKASYLNDHERKKERKILTRSQDRYAADQDVDML
jgi:hypothetical protein